MKKLKEDILKEIEFLILSESYQSGEKLPTERDLAIQFEVSRPVIHEALLVLESRGLITMRPRHGTVVNDFRKRGTLDLLTSLLCHTDEGLNLEVLESHYRVRAMVESDAAFLAASNMSGSDIQELKLIIESGFDDTNPLEMAIRDFTIHHLISVYSGNIVYPLIINTLKPVYLEFLQTFYKNDENNSEIRKVQLELLSAFEKKDSPNAASLMKQLSSFTID